MNNCKNQATLFPSFHCQTEHCGANNPGGDILMSVNFQLPSVTWAYFTFFVALNWNFLVIELKTVSFFVINKLPICNKQKMVEWLKWWNRNKGSKNRIFWKLYRFLKLIIIITVTVSSDAKQYCTKTLTV